MSPAKLNVLIVEDDSATRRMLEHAVKSRGHAPVSFATAEEALGELERQACPLIIIDLVLPGMDGLELCRRLRQRPEGNTLYLLVATACNQPDDLQAVLDAGANDYLPKPFDLPLLQIRLSIAEQQLRDLQRSRRMEELHRTVLREALDGFFICDAEDRLIEVNDTYCQISGHARASLLGMTVTELFPERPATGSDNGADHRLETRQRRQDGTLIEVELCTRELGGSGGWRFSFVRDLTERKRVEKSLRYRAQVQELASTLAADFIDAPGQEIDEHLTGALQRLGQFAGADRCSLLLFSEDGLTMRINHEYCAPGVPSQKNHFQSITVAAFPWLQ